MRLRVRLIAALGFLAVSLQAHAGSRLNLLPDGRVQIDNRTVKCGTARTVLDPMLPNLGIFVPRSKLVVLNPAILRRHSEAVRLFVYFHECGHHHVGASELDADCWAVKKGVSDGWMTSQAVREICKSFGDTPGTPTHPSSARRCRNLEQCHASTLNARHQTAGAPTLLSGPNFVRSGISRERDQNDIVQAGSATD